MQTKWINLSVYGKIVGISERFEDCSDRCPKSISTASDIELRKLFGQSGGGAQGTIPPHLHHSNAEKAIGRCRSKTLQSDTEQRS
jgi:hypothetical protein